MKPTVSSVVLAFLLGVVVATVVRSPRRESMPKDDHTQGYVLVNRPIGDGQSVTTRLRVSPTPYSDEDRPDAWSLDIGGKHYVLLPE